MFNYIGESNAVNPGIGGGASDRAGVVWVLSPDTAPGLREAGARFTVPAHGSGRGSSRAERKENEGYREHSLRIPEEILNSG
ncbi:MAG: hypothetical protein KH366_16025, partial [Clostridiaceae bacterium]|nr:hypothetical protein [Clostridiaceae bacterium]